MLGNVPAPRDLPTSASATGELAALAPHVERIRAASASAFAPATRRAYGGSWAQFLAWADGEGLQALPAPPKSLREARPSSSRSFLECRTRHSGLADDRHQRAVGIRLLHRDVAAAPPDFDETVGSEDAADLATGQHAQSSQLRPQSGSHRLRRAAAC